LFVENSQVGAAYNIDDLVDKKPPFLVDEAFAKVARVFKANGYNVAPNDRRIALVSCAAGSSLPNFICPNSRFLETINCQIE